MKTIGVILGVLALAISLRAAEVLRNSDVIQLVQAGLPAEIVLKKIQVSETAFDTSVVAILALREARVPDAVIEAMLGVGPSQPVASATIPAGSIPKQEAGLAGAPQPGRNFVHPVLGVEMIWVQPGEFIMGGVTRQLEGTIMGIPGTGGMASLPRTKVTLTKGYWIAKTEVTQAQWRKIMGSGQEQLTRRVKGGWIDTLQLHTQVGDQLPAFAVPYDEAVDCCRRIQRTEQEAMRLPEGYSYKLPTEAQWEYAARAGSTEMKDHGTNHRSWNNAWIAAYGEHAWFSANSPKGGKGFSKYALLQPVGTKKANAWGIHDMQGSVGEWCRGVGTDELPGGSVIDPLWMEGTRHAIRNSVVSRGGSFFEHAMNCSFFFRMPTTPGAIWAGHGMRVALTVD